MPEVKGQGHSEENDFFSRGIPSIYGRPSVVRAAEAYRWTVRRWGWLVI